MGLIELNLILTLRLSIIERIGLVVSLVANVTIGPPKVLAGEIEAH